MVDRRSYEWTPWVELTTAFSDPVLPPEPGLYRIRRVGSDAIDYIGQTGVGVRARVRMLRGITNEAMPYRDPHTAAPALWALLHSTSCRFEVSAIRARETATWRKGLEAVAIALYRQEKGQSPTANFGRMPAGYRISSGNNARLVSAGKRFRGGPTDISEACHLPSIPPPDGLSGDPQSESWCGHRWSAWLPLAECRTAIGSGLYRIRDRDSLGLLYIGEGVVRNRLGAHLRKARSPRRPVTAQERAFSTASHIEFSSSAGEWYTHQRLELETDLIAAHMLALDRVPPAQFIT